MPHASSIGPRRCPEAAGPVKGISGAVHRVAGARIIRRSAERGGDGIGTADSEDRGAGGGGAAPVRAQLRAQGDDPRPRRGRPRMGHGRQRVRRPRHRDQRDFARPRRPGAGAGAYRSGGPALAYQQPLLRGAGGAPRRGAVRGVVRRTGLLLQFRCGGERGRDQARAQAREPPPRPGEARDRDLPQWVPRPHPRHGDRHRAAEVPRGLRAVAGRLPVLRLQRRRRPRRRDRGPHLRGAGGAGAGGGGGSSPPGAASSRRSPSAAGPTTRC